MFTSLLNYGLCHPARQYSGVACSALQRYGRDPRACQRQQRKAQAQWELQQLRSDWQEWEVRAEEQARAQRKKAQRVAGELSQRARKKTDYSWIQLQGGRGGTNSPSDAALDILQEKAQAAASRFEERQRRAPGRQRFSKGINDLDPSRGLERKVQRLAALTSELQDARLARASDSESEQWLVQKQAGHEEAWPAGRVQERQHTTSEWPPEHEVSGRREAEYPSGSAGTLPELQPQSSGLAEYDWTGRAAAAFEQPSITSAQRTRPTQQLATAVSGSRQHKSLPEVGPPSSSSSASIRGATESVDAVGPSPTATFARLESMEGAQPSTINEKQRWQLLPSHAPSGSGAEQPQMPSVTRQAGKNGAERRCSLPNIRVAAATMPLERERRAQPMKGQPALGPPTVRANTALPPPPPPLPLGRKLSERERKERFWAALRGEAPASDLVRQTS